MLLHTREVSSTLQSSIGFHLGNKGESGKYQNGEDNVCQLKPKRKVLLVRNSVNGTWKPWLGRLARHFSKSLVGQPVCHSCRRGITSVVELD